MEVGVWEEIGEFIFIAKKNEMREKFLCNSEQVKGYFRNHQFSIA